MPTSEKSMRFLEEHIPELAQALLNAVMHKDYSSGIPIQISVYEDQLVRLSGPAPSW